MNNKRKMKKKKLLFYHFKLWIPVLKPSQGGMLHKGHYVCPSSVDTWVSHPAETWVLETKLGDDRRYRKDNRENTKHA
jgi:hypothetical protein